MPGIPVSLDTFGGLVATARPEDLPEGASPRNYDVDYTTGSFMQRPGLENVYSYSASVFGPNPGSSAVDVDTQALPWLNPANILLDDGSFATVSLNSATPITLSVAFVEVDRFIRPSGTVYQTKVQFTGLTVAGNYTFSGLTNFPSLNGQTLTTISNGGNIAVFSFGSAIYANTPDTGSAVTSVTSPTSDNIQVTGFGFALPATASVSGITVSIKGLSASASVFAQLLNNGVPVGSPKSIVLPVANDTVTLGGPTDTWNASWIYADIDNSNFGVNIWAYSTFPVAVSLDYVSITIGGSADSVNFNGMTSANLDEADIVTLALDANGLTWEEDVTNTPNVLNSQPLIPAVPASSYLKGIDADGLAYMAYSDLTTGTAPPMQFNGTWCDRITQVGPGAPPSFTPSTQSGTQASVTAWAFAGGILTLTAVNTFVAGELVTFSAFAGGLAALNGLTFSVLGTGLSGTQFEIATSLIAGSGSDTGLATPQYAYPIVASPNGITQPPAQSDPDSAGHLYVLLWSAGPGSRDAGDIVTVYYKNSFAHTTPDQTLVDAFNSGVPVYVYITGAPFGNGTYQVQSVGNALPPTRSHWGWYFTVQVPTSSYQAIANPTGTYQITQATVTTTTAVPQLAPGDQVSLAGVTNSAWDGLYTIVQALNSGSFSISQTQLTAGTATYTYTLVTGTAPAVGQLVTVTNTLNAGGQLNVTDAVIASSTGGGSGTFTITGFPTTVNFAVQVEAGQATTAGTKFVIDPGAALAGATTGNPILGNSGDGTLTVVGAAIGGTFPIGAGIRQGVVFFITRNGAVTKPSPPAVFTVNTGANWITASQIPIGPPDVVARGIAFTEAGQNGVPGANFYTYDTPVIFTVGGVTFVASALIVPDNVTTTAKFTFSDEVLLSSDEIDIPGNNYFNFIEIGDPAWMFQYANRMLYGLCRTKVFNFLNLSFDGGYLPTNTTLLPMPLGWNGLGNGSTAAYSITAFSITSNVATIVAVNSLIAGTQVIINDLSVGTYLNGLQFVVLTANATQFTVAFVHANVALTADTGTANVVTSSLGLVTSPVFGNALIIHNLGTSTWTDQVVLYQSAYQDAYHVAILQPNTAYSVRITGRSLNADGQKVAINLLTYSNGAFGQITYGSSVFTFNQGSLVTQILPLTTGIATIPSDLILAIETAGITSGSEVELDRIEIFPTNRPVDTTTIWVSYAGIGGIPNFEAVDEVSGRLGCGVDNNQAAQGAYEILEQLYVEKTGSTCITQDSPNYEPNQWQVRTIQGSGAVGPNAFSEGEEWSLKANRSGLYFFDGGKPEPIMRELQSAGVNGSIWETVNWNVGNKIWLRNDLLNRKFMIGMPMITPNFWCPGQPLVITNIESHQSTFFPHPTASTVTLTFTTVAPEFVAGQTYTLSNMGSVTQFNGVTMNCISVSGNTASMTVAGVFLISSRPETGSAIADPNIPTSPNIILMCNYTGCPTAEELMQSGPVHTTMFGDLKALDMRRKWSIWRIISPVAEFITRPDGITQELFIANGTSSSKIYRLENGAGDDTGQNTDDGAAINWLYTTYGFVGSKQGQQLPGLGALRKVWYYLAATIEGMGQVVHKYYLNTLGVIVKNGVTINPITHPYPFTLETPSADDQERVLEYGAQRMFVELSSTGTGGYTEVKSLMVDGEADKNAPHRGVAR